MRPARYDCSERKTSLVGSMPGKGTCRLAARITADALRPAPHCRAFLDFGLCCCPPLSDNEASFRAIMDSYIMGDERRSWPRKRLSKPVSVRLQTSGAGETRGVTRDVSGSGIYLLMSLAPDVGAAVELFFDMPTLLGDSFYPVVCKGTVVRVDNAGEQSGVAVAFKSVDVLARA